MAEGRVSTRSRHVAVDDASRLAYIALMPNARKESAVIFLAHAVAWFNRHGVSVERQTTHQPDREGQRPWQ